MYINLYNRYKDYDVSAPLPKNMMSALGVSEAPYDYKLDKDINKLYADTDKLFDTTLISLPDTEQLASYKDEFQQGASSILDNPNISQKQKAMEMMAYTRKFSSSISQDLRAILDHDAVLKEALKKNPGLSAYDRVKFGQSSHREDMTSTLQSPLLGDDYVLDSLKKYGDAFGNFSISKTGQLIFNADKAKMDELRKQGNKKRESALLKQLDMIVDKDPITLDTFVETFGHFMFDSDVNFRTMGERMAFNSATYGMPEDERENVRFNFNDPYFVRSARDHMMQHLKTMASGMLKAKEYEVDGKSTGRSGSKKNDNLVVTNMSSFLSDRNAINSIVVTKTDIDKDLERNGIGGFSGLSFSDAYDGGIDKYIDLVNANAQELLKRGKSYSVSVSDSHLNDFRTMFTGRYVSGWAELEHNVNPSPVANSGVPALKYKEHTGYVNIDEATTAFLNGGTNGRNQRVSLNSDGRVNSPLMMHLTRLSSAGMVTFGDVLGSAPNAVSGGIGVAAEVNTVYDKTLKDAIIATGANSAEGAKILDQLEKAEAAAEADYKNRGGVSPSTKYAKIKFISAGGEEEELLVGITKGATFRPKGSPNSPAYRNATTISFRLLFGGITPGKGSSNNIAFNGSSPASRAVGGVNKTYVDGSTDKD